MTATMHTLGWKAIATIVCSPVPLIQGVRQIGGRPFRLLMHKPETLPEGLRRRLIATSDDGVIAPSHFLSPAPGLAVANQPWHHLVASSMVEGGWVFSEISTVEDILAKA